MYSIYTIGKDQEMVDTGIGFTVQTTSIGLAINLAGQFVTSIQKEGKRASIEAVEYNGMFVVRVVGRHNILAAYAVKED